MLVCPRVVGPAGPESVARRSSSGVLVRVLRFPDQEQDGWIYIYIYICIYIEIHDVFSLLTIFLAKVLVVVVVVLACPRVVGPAGPESVARSSSGVLARFL